MKRAFHNINLWLIHFFIGAIIFVVPILVIPVFLYPFTEPKTFFFLFLVELALFFYLTLILFYPKYRPKNNYILYTFLSFVVLSVFSGIFGRSPSISFWSNPQRFDGTLVLVHVFLFFFITAFTVRTKKTLNIFLWTSVVSSVLVALSVYFSALDYFGIRSLKTMFNISATGGFIGNDSFTGAYLLFNVFFIVYLLFNTEKRYIRYILELFLFTILLCPIFFNFDIFRGLVSFKDILHNPMMFLGAARAATISSILGLVLGVFLFFTNYSKKIIRRSAKFITGLFLACILIAVVMAYSPGTGAHKWLGEKTGGFRFTYWNQAVEGIKERPLLGWGPGNFFLVNEKYFDPTFVGKDYFAFQGSSDKAHSVIFDTLVSVGVLGFLAYLSIYISCLFVLWRSKNIQYYVKAILTGLLLAYFLQNLVFFDILVSYLMFAFVLAVIIILDRGFKEQSSIDVDVKSFSLKKALYILPLLIILIVSSLRYFILLPAKEAYLDYKFYTLPPEVRGFYKENRDFSDFGTSREVEIYAFDIHSWYAAYVDNFTKHKDNNSAYIKDIDGIIADVVRNSKSTGVTFWGADVIFELYDIRHQLANDNNIFLPQMKYYSEREISLSPNNARGYVDYARSYFYEKDYKKAIDILEKGLSLNPLNARIHATIINIAHVMGDKKLLEEKMIRAKMYVPGLDIKFK